MDFYRRMEMVCRCIPYGRVASYGQIALLCGKPHNARQVGYALGHGRLKGDVPAHRIVNSLGALSGAGAFDYPDTQKNLLEAEGIQVSPDNRVDMNKYGWKNTWEQALCLRAQFEEENV